MSQSLSKVYLHLIFHIKSNSPTIRREDQSRVFAYLGELINAAGCINIYVNGIDDHVHALCLLGRECTVSHLLEEIKRNSSRWIKSIDRYYGNFAWQGGYAAYSVSQSVVETTLQYIKNQEEHHRKVSFRDEYLKFLQLYGIEYDERYVFAD